MKIIPLQAKPTIALHIRPKMLFLSSERIFAHKNYVTLTVLELQKWFLH